MVIFQSNVNAVLSIVYNFLGSFYFVFTLMFKYFLCKSFKVFLILIQRKEVSSDGLCMIRLSIYDIIKIHVFVSSIHTLGDTLTYSRNTMDLKTYLQHNQGCYLLF
jgi:hypothetical protein